MSLFVRTSVELSICMEQLTDNFTVDQLSACALKLTEFLDILGLSILGPVKTDIRSNVRKISAAKTRDISVAITEKKSVAMGILWLSYTFNFVQELFTLILDPKLADWSLVAIAKHAYERTLKPHHNVAVRFIFDMGLKTLPSRESFLASLDLPATWDHVEMFRFLQGAKSFNMTIDDIYRAHSIECA